jgi:AraC-like DNA-binding protein
MTVADHIYYKKYPSCAELAGDIHFFYHFKSRLQQTQRILPLGTAELTIAVQPALTSDGIFYSNLLTQYAILEPQYVEDIVGISFHPWGFRNLFGREAAGLANRKVPLQEVLSRTLAEALANRCHRLSAIEDILDAIQGWLIRQQHKPVPAALRQSVEAIHAAKGAIQPGELYPTLSVSERRLEQLFAAYIGTTPRHYILLKKFHAAVAAMDTPTTLTRIAQQANYYDQSHFIRQFKSFAGISPLDYLRENRLLNNINKADFF